MVKCVLGGVFVGGKVNLCTLTLFIAFSALDVIFKPLLNKFYAYKSKEQPAGANTK